MCRRWCCLWLSGGGKSWGTSGEAPACRPAGLIPRRSQSYFQSKDGKKACVSAPGRQSGGAALCPGSVGCLVVFGRPLQGGPSALLTEFQCESGFPTCPQSCLTTSPRVARACWLRMTIAPSQGPGRVHEAGGMQVPRRSGRRGRDP